MNKQYTWDLDDLLKNKSLEELFNEWEQQENKLVELYPSFLDSLTNFKNWLNENEKSEVISNRLENYISNSMHENLSDANIMGWMQKLQNKSNEFSIVFSNYSNLVIKNKDKINEYLKDEEIKEYQIQFDHIFKSEKYLLDDKSEKLLTKVSRITPGIDDIFSTLIDNDLKFDDATNSKNKSIKLNTQADVFKNLKSTDEQLRKTTWFSFHKAFYSLRSTLTKTLYYNYLQFNTFAKIRGFENYISRTAYEDDINVSFILKLYEKIKLFKPLISRYQKARSSVLKKMFNLKKINPWDGYLELTKKENKYTIEDSKQIVLNALNILGKEYVSVVQRAFDERWISWLPKPNKYTGAYSIGGTKGLDKFYILMNFDETLRSVYTLAHELGHSLNSYYCNKTQKIYVGTSIFYAEVSSITNEMFLNYYLLENNNSEKVKLSILDEMISNFIATTTRQVIFSEFEYKANELVNNSQPFSYEVISNLYKEVSDEYLESKKDYSKEPYMYSLITPLRIPHFYAGNFYVYKYAIGQIAAVIIASRIKKDPDNNKEKLFDFLSSGNRLSPLDTIKLLGIDLEQDEIWSEAYNIFESWINDFELIAKKYK